jgi:hypothetical protein
MALHETDWRWAEQRCLAALGDNRGEVRAAAITGLGHLARVHHVVTADVVIPKLRELQDDPQLGGLAEDALEDITLFTSGSTLSS